MNKPYTTLETMIQLAAILLRDGIDKAIREAENNMKLGYSLGETCDGYFSAQRAEYRKAITQLQRMRAEAHSRASDAYREENPDYAR